MEKKSHLITFEEKVDLSELTERERQAYEIGKEEGLRKFNPSMIPVFIAIIFFCIIIGVILHQKGLVRVV